MIIKPFTEKPLTLENDGKLTLFFVGVGSAFSKRLYQTNLLIIKGKDHLLIDAGTKCAQALYELGLSITNVHNLLITHSHADHIGSLEEAGLLARYVTKQKPNMVINETYQHLLWDMSLRGGMGFNEEKAGDILKFSDLFNPVRPKVVEGFNRETMSADIGSINVKIMRTKHIPDTSDTWQTSFWSCGVIIDDRILFTADTRYDEELVLDFDSKLNLEAIFHDCQFFTGGVHASIEELKNIPPEIKKRIYLSHYGDNWEQFEDKVREYGFADLARQHVYYIFD